MTDHSSKVLDITRSARGVTTLWLNRPDKHNALNPELIHALHRQLTMLQQDSTTRVLILAGRGPSFCSGADLHYMKSMAQYSQEENISDAARLAAMLQTLQRFPKPVVAAVHGNVFAGATGLIACADIVLAAEDTRFCISEVKLGLVPAVISPFVISRIGMHQARRYFLTAEVFDAGSAVAAGLVHECVKADNLMAAALALAEQLVKNAPGALSDTKALLHHLVPVPASQALTDYTCELIARVRAGGEGQAGLQAFFDRVIPPWIDDDTRGGI